MLEVISREQSEADISREYQLREAEKEEGEADGEGRMKNFEM